MQNCERRVSLAQRVMDNWQGEAKDHIWRLEYFLEFSRDSLARSTVPGHISSASSILQWDSQAEEEFTDDERTQVYVNIRSVYGDILDSGENHDLVFHDSGHHGLVNDTIFLGFLWESVYDVRPQQIYMDRAILVLESVAAFMAHHHENAVSTVLLSQTKSLRLKSGDTTAMSCVLDLPFTSLSTSPISLDQVPAARYRFIDAIAFSTSTSLRVVESDVLLKNRYVAISYVWKGLPPSLPNSNPAQQTMTIKNADNADPISLEALRIACRAAVQLDCALLWLDGLCIKQGDEDDKAWQISRMFSIYEHSRVCLILPGGLSRLVALHEETNWVSRAWTLQEAIAPPRCKVLFTWQHGTCYLTGIAGVYVEQIQGEEVAMAELMSLLGASDMEMYLVTKSDDTDPEVEERQKIEINLIVGDKRPGDGTQRNALIGALDLKGKEGMASAIWRAAMMRTAYRPVDMILSIMGMFGVSLDARKFAFDDRLGAAVALMKAILENGGKAEWLGVIPSIPPGEVLSTTPSILELGVGIEGDFWDSDAMTTGLLWWLKGAPGGFVDEEGYVNIMATVAAVRLASEESGDPSSESTCRIRDYEKRHWEVIETGGESSPPPYAVRLGEKKNYLNGIYPTWSDPENNLFMLVDGESKSKLRVTGYAVGRSEVLDSTGWCVNKTVRVK